MQFCLKCMAVLLQWFKTKVTDCFSQLHVYINPTRDSMLSKKRQRYSSVALCIYNPLLNVSFETVLIMSIHTVEYAAYNI